MIYGDGLQSRDFTYVANVAQANLLACETPVSGVTIMNIACGERHSLLELLSVLGLTAGAACSPAFSEARTGDVRHSQADITRAKRTIGYSVLVGFTDGLERTLDWYRAVP